MIALLEGKIEFKKERYLILLINSIGYKIYCTPSALDKLSVNQQVRLFTHQYLRENIMDLYGFLDSEELEFFEMLISISGIGPKAGLSVLSIASIKDLKASIVSGQVSLLSKVSGIGKKTAERIILELSSKILASGDDVKRLVSDDEAVDALVGLGYNRRQASEALKQVPKKIEKVEERVRQALKNIGK